MNDGLADAQFSGMDGVGVRAAGNILLDASIMNGNVDGDITLNAAVFSDAGSVSVLANRNIAQNVAGTAKGDIIVGSGDGTIDVEAAGGAIVMADGTLGKTDGGHIRYAASGGITLGLLDARTQEARDVAEDGLDNDGDSLVDSADPDEQNWNRDTDWGLVSVWDDLGSVTDGNGGTYNIIARGAVFTVPSGGIGEADGTGGGPIDLRVGTLAALSQGNQYFIQAPAGRDLTIGTVGDGSEEINWVTFDPVGVIPYYIERLSDLESTAGSVKVGVGNGSLTVNDGDAAVQNPGMAGLGVKAAGDVLFELWGGDLVLNAAVDAGNNVTVLTLGQVEQNWIDTDLDGIIDRDNGDWQWQAGEDVFGSIRAGGTILVEAFGGDLTMMEGTVSQTDGGEIAYAAMGNMTIATLDARTGADRLAGTRDNQADWGNVLLVGNGSILDAQTDTVEADAEGFSAQTGNPREVNVYGNTAQIMTLGSVGEAGNPLDTELATVAAESTGGDLYLYESSGITIGAAGRPDDPATAGTDERTSITVSYMDDVPLTLYIDPVSDLRAAGNVKLETVDGGITVEEGAYDPLGITGNPADLPGGVLAAGGDVLLAANGAAADVILDAAVEATVGNVTVLAGRHVAQNADIAAGGTIDVEAFGGSVTMADGTVSRTTAGGNIRYAANRAVDPMADGVDNDGDGWVDALDEDGEAQHVTIGTLDARTAADRAGDTLTDQANWGDVQVLAGGSISDAHADTVGHDAEGFATQTGDPRTVNVYADGLQLQSGQMFAFDPEEAHIGLAGNPLDIEVLTAAAEAYQGGVYLYESTDVTVDNVDYGGVNRIGLDSSVTPLIGETDQSDIRGWYGSAKLETLNGSITVNEGVENLTDWWGMGVGSQFDDILLAANGAGSDVILNATVEAGRHVTVLARDSVEQNVVLNPDETLLSRGDILAGFTDLFTPNDPQGSIDVEAFGGSVTMADGTVSQTQGGHIRYAAPMADVTLGLLDAGDGMVQIIAGGSILDARADTVVHGAEGFAGQTGADRTENIIASAAQLDAGGDIGAAGTFEADGYTVVTPGNPLDLEVGTLAVSAGGSVYLYESTDVTVDNVAFGGVNRIGLDSSVTPLIGAGSLSGLTAGLHAKIETLNGTLTVGGVGADAGGDVLLAANGTGSDVVLDSDVYFDGHATVLARDSVLQNADIYSVPYGDFTVDVEAFEGNIVMVGDATSVSGYEAGGHIRYAAAGDVTLGGLYAHDGMVSVLAGGDILDGNEAAVNVYASAAQLVAGGSVGGPGAAAIDTEVGTLAARASGGSVYVSEANALTLGTVGAISVNRIGLDSSVTPVAGEELVAAVRARNNVKIEAGVYAAGNLTVSTAVGAGDDVLLHARQGDLAVNAAVSAGKQAVDDLTLLASLGITQSAVGDITAGGTIDVEAQGGSVEMADGATATAGGNIRYLAAQDIVLGGLRGANVMVEATGGSVTDGGDADKDVEALTAQLVAGGSVGGPGAAAIDTAVGTLAARASGGSVYVSEADALDLGTVAAIDVNRIGLDSTTTLQPGVELGGARARNHVKVENGVDAAGDLTVSRRVAAGDDVLLDARDGNLLVNAAVDAGAQAVDDLTLLASLGITQNADITAGGTIDVEAFGGSVTMADGTASRTLGGNIRYAAAGDVTLGVLDARTAADRAGGTLDEQANWGDVRVIAGGNILDAHADDMGHDEEGFIDPLGTRIVNVYADGAQFAAGGTLGAAGVFDADGHTILAAGNPLDIEAGTLAAEADAGMYLYESSNIRVDGVVFDGVNRIGMDSSTTPGLGAETLSDLTSSGGSVKLVVDDGSLIVTDGLDGDGIGVTAADDVLLDSYVGMRASGITLNAGVAAGDSVSIYADGTIAQNADITAGGTINLEAFFNGSITMADGTVSTAAGNILYAADENVTIGGLVGANVRVEAGTGSILDGGDTDKDVVAETAQLVAGNAVGGPGAAAIDTAVDTLAAEAGLGGIYVSEADALTIGNVAAIDVSRIGLDSSTLPWPGEALAGAAADGNVKIVNGADAAGDLTVAGAVTAGGDVLLQALNGNVAVNAPVAAGDDVSVLASLGITQSGSITAGGTIDVEAFGGSINLTAVSQTAGGNIRYAATGDVVLDGLLHAGAGNVAVEAGGDIRDNGGQITVSANGFASQNNMVNIVADTVSLSAGGDIGDPGAGTSGTRSFNPITVRANGVAAQGDNIAIYGKPNLTIGSVDAVEVTRVTPDDVDQTATSPALSGIRAGTGDVNLMADISVIDGNGGDTDITAGTLTVSAGHIIGSGGGQNTIDPLEIQLNGGHGPYDIWVNNVAGSPDKMVYAFFNTVGGNSSPVAAAAKGSGALIFVNGQYVGGDPTFVQLFAAVEAFPAETPELKSRQGVFGDPFFLHDQMDINEPVALGLIDLILAEKATITGDPEIPADAYREILSGGLSPSSSFWFGTGTDDKQEEEKTEKKEQAENSQPARIQLSALR
ncbi:MAG: hypothetical protein RBT78_12440 [Kiritimatiellia bacterium]|nr:hypothetical protein [Kiritimatiellia bacterium]